MTNSERNPNDERRFQKSHVSRIRTPCSPSPLPSPLLGREFPKSFRALNRRTAKRQPSPSPPREERAGERRPFQTYRVAGSRKGSIICSAFDNPSRSELLQRGPWVSLSLRERAGVRGNGPWKLKAARVLQLAHQIRMTPGTRLVQSAFGFSALFRPSTFGLRISRPWSVS